MVDININTNKVAETGRDIIRLVNEYNQTLNTMEARIKNMPISTQEWVGDSAERFAHIFTVEKNNYVEFGNVLNAYGKYLVNMAESIERTIKSSRL